MSIAETSFRAATTSAPILDVLAERWSPRSYAQAEAIDERKLASALEAARWSASAGNSQPWRFIVARRGTPEFDQIVDALMDFNQVWAPKSGALVVFLAQVTTAEGKDQRWAEYDLGQAAAHFSVQAHADGLHVHQMGGFRADDLQKSFGYGDDLRPVSVAAIGTVGSADDLPDEKSRARETAPRTRTELADLLLVNA